MPNNARRGGSGSHDPAAYANFEANFNGTGSFDQFLSMLFGSVGNVFNNTGRAAGSAFGSTVGSAVNGVMQGLGLGSDIGAVLNSLLNRWAGTGLTPADYESAELQRYLRQTGYGDEVKSMLDAGLNPALLYNKGASPSTPSLSMPNQGMTMSEMMQLALLPEQKELLKAQAQDTKQSAQVKEKEVSWFDAEKAANLSKLSEEVESLGLDNYSKRIVNEYVRRMQEADLRVKENTAEQLDWSARSLRKSIEKMDYEELSLFIDACDTQEHINYLLGLERLTDEQVRECQSLIKKLDREAQYIGLQVKNFDDITVVGSSSMNTKFGPFGLGESRPVTLATLKTEAKERQEKLSKDKGRSWKKIKGDYPE